MASKDAVVIGREEETQELNEILNSKKSEFVAVFGRRRVGKTYLVRKFFTNQKCMFFHCTGLQNASLEEQLENFADTISETFYNKTPIQTPDNWKNSFKLLTSILEKYNKKEKLVLFFDELPWMVTHRSRLLEVLDYFWNKYWVNFDNLKLIICGSSASWILKKIIYNKGGLHNRVTKQIILKPFTLKETKKYLESLNCKFEFTQILEIYMVTGGIAFYLSQIKRNLSAKQNINNLCFRKEGLLFDEFDKLFRSLFSDAEAYMELIRIIAKNNSGISRAELEEKSKLSQKGGTFSERLKDLEETGFIISFLPLWHKTRGVYYKVIDEYSLFYLNWIEPQKKTLLKIEKNAQVWNQKYKTPEWFAWAGYAFEAVCYKHIYIIKQILHIPLDSKTGAWHLRDTEKSDSQGTQIDLIFDRSDGVITLCEIKHTMTPFVIDKEYAKNILNKKNSIVAHHKIMKQIFICFITTQGLKKNMYSEELVNGIIILKDLFK